VWRKRLGDSHGTCAVSKGRLFLFDRQGDQVRVLCCNCETGADIWTFAAPTSYIDQLGYGNGPRCSPVVDDDRVYAYGADGMLFCISVQDGGLIWKADTARQFGVVQFFFGVGSTPVVDGNLLIVLVGGCGIESDAVNLSDLQGRGSGIVAFNKYTGEVVYSVTDALASYASPKLATIDGRRWCFAFARGTLIGLDPSNGKVDFEYPWRARLSAAVSAATPVVVGNEVFISEAYGPGSSLLKVRPGGFEVVWRDSPRDREKALQTHWNTPIYHEGYLYACSGRHPHDGELRCIEWRTGKVMWSERRRSRSSLLYVDGHFVALGEYGEVVLFKATPDRFELVASTVLKENSDDPNSPGLLKYPAWSAPVLSHGLLYVRGKEQLVCLEVIPLTPNPK
jgi:outer membrane protein assembly factor BamB